MKSVFEQYQAEFHDVEFCCYCLEQKGDKWSCCKENHFVPFQDLYLEDQKEIIEWEIEWAAEQSKRQVELINGR
jgi:hypothetical protein